MALAALNAGDIKGYLRANGDTPQATWLFLHIPKTAGSSFRSELARRLLPEANITVNYADDLRPHNVKMDEAIERFCARAQREPVRFASGHLLRPMMARIEARLPETRLVTMLRDPVARVVSDFRYQRTPQHPPYRAFIERFPRFEDYLEARESQNKMTEFLRRAPDQSVAEIIDDIERSFAFVGITELYPLSFKLLMALLGDHSAPTVYERRTEDSDENRIDNLDALTPRIREVNRVDMAIYKHFRTRLERQREAILATLQAEAAPTETHRA